MEQEKERHAIERGKRGGAVCDEAGQGFMEGGRVEDGGRGWRVRVDDG